MKKILVAGPFNSGKTTFVRTANESDFDGVESDVFDCEELKETGETTTVGIDITKVTVNGEQILVIGLPGQERFSFLWEILGRNFDGLLLLQPADAPSDAVKSYIEFFKNCPAFNSAKKAIVVTKLDKNPNFNIGELSIFGMPVLKCDPRSKSDVLRVLSQIS